MDTIITTDANGLLVKQDLEPVDITAEIREMNESYQHALDLFNRISGYLEVPDVSKDQVALITPALQIATIWATASQNQAQIKNTLAVTAA